MSLDRRARTAASSVRDHLDEITVPEPGAVVRRARRRRSIAASATTVAVAVVVVVTFALVRRDDSARSVNVAVTPTSAPAATTDDSVWSTVDKPSSGIGAGTSLHALTSDGTSLLLAGERPGNDGFVVTTWWSTDGLRWTESDHPTEHDRVSAIGTHAGIALAIGAPGGPNAFVWRSSDGGRHWDEIAKGAVFGGSVPNNRPGAIVTDVLWHAGWWIASGGAADGYEGIWISRDGVAWQLVLDSHASGSIDGVVLTPDGSLLAYGVNAMATPDSVEIGWSTTDPTNWGAAIPLVTPGRNYLQSVSADGTLAIGDDLDTHGRPTPLLRSDDGGRTWVRDETFTKLFPTAWAWTATTAPGLTVVAGTSTDSNRPRVWVSADDRTWSTGPEFETPPSLPTTSIPVIPPKGALDLMASIGDRMVFVGGSAALGDYYTLSLHQGRAALQGSPLATEQTVPGLAHATDLLRNVPVAYGPVQYAEIVSTTRDKVAGIFGTTPQSPADAIEVLRIVGTFVCNECSRPPHAQAPRGSEILILIPRDSDRFPAGGGSSFSIGERSTDLARFGTVYRMQNP
jgi:hypothetical protein